MERERGMKYYWLSQPFYQEFRGKHVLKRWWCKIDEITFTDKKICIIGHTANWTHHYECFKKLPKLKEKK